MFKILLAFIFIRPFISSLAFPYLNFIYSAFLILFLAKSGLIKKDSFNKIQGAKYPLIFFCFSLIISLVFSVNRLNSVTELYKYITGLSLFLIAASLNYKNTNTLIKTIVLAGWVISLLAIYQYFFGFGHLLNHLAKEKVNIGYSFWYVSAKRVFMPFITPNTLGSYLIMIIALVLSFKRRFWLAVPLCAALFLTKSLGALLSLFLAISLYFYLIGKINKRKFVLLLGLFVAIALIFLTRLNWQRHTQPIFSIVTRWMYWKETFKIIKSSPLIGVGLGNFCISRSHYAHNSYLQIWAEMGLFAVICWLWLVFLSISKGIKNLKTSVNHSFMPAGIISASIIFLIHNLIDFSFFLPEVSLIWWLILGLNFSENTSLKPPV